MIVEKVIFSILAFYLFLVMFFKMMKKVDSAYIIVLILQAIGIALEFIEIIFSLKFNIVIKAIIYLIAIIIPIIIILLERKGKNFIELVHIARVKFYNLIRKYKKKQRYSSCFN